jgi:L-rhamnose-H+ transport protein
MFLLGLFIVLAAGACNALFALPMKKMVRWEWENQWGLWSVWALVVSPWIIAFLTVPDLFGVYGQVESGVLWKTFLFGIGGGIGMVTFGFGLKLVGFSLGFSIILGLTAATGSLVPLLLQNPQGLATRSGAGLLVGLLVTVLGVAWCGRAGMLREKAGATGDGGGGSAGRSLTTGLIVCVVSAIFNAMINLSFSAGAPIAEAAQAGLSGTTSSFRATNAVWAIGMAGAFLPNVLYTGYLMKSRGTLARFSAAQTGSYWWMGMVMGLVWMCGYALYGISTTLMGEYGVAAGWVLFFAVTVLTGNIMGFATGEWSEAPARAKLLMKQGIGILIAAIVIIGLGGSLL